MVLVPATDANVRQAAECLRRGGLVAFPTETVYGLGANALLPEACARIFEVKRRPRFDPLIVHVLDVAHVEGLVKGFNERARRLAEAFWPGPLTLVLEKQEGVPDIVTAGLATVAVRVPSHPVARALISYAKCPIAAPSANPFGYLSPTTAEHVERQLGTAVDYILDGGACEGGVESTIVDVTSDLALLLRPGGLETERIEAQVGPLGRPERMGMPVAPGQLESHYAPRTRIVLLEGPAAAGAEKDKIGLLAFVEPGPAVRASFAAVEVLSPGGTLVEAAARLFACLHRLDTLGLDAILAEPVPEAGLGVAIRDRLQRAAAELTKGRERPHRSGSS